MAQVEEGHALEVGAYALQAAIAAEHSRAETGAVDWHRVIALYDVLMRAQASPVVTLNRAVAIGMRDGPLEAIPIIEGLIASKSMKTYQPAHVARPELLRKADRRAEAREAFLEVLGLGGAGSVRGLIERRLSELG